MTLPGELYDLDAIVTALRRYECCGVVDDETAARDLEIDEAIDATIRAEIAEEDRR